MYSPKETEMCALPSIYRQAKIVNAFLVPFTSFCLLHSLCSWRTIFSNAIKRSSLPKPSAPWYWKECYQHSFQVRFSKFPWIFMKYFVFQNFFPLPKFPFLSSFLFLSCFFFFGLCRSQAEAQNTESLNRLYSIRRLL